MGPNYPFKTFTAAIVHAVDWKDREDDDHAKVVDARNSLDAINRGEGIQTALSWTQYKALRRLLASWGMPEHTVDRLRRQVPRYNKKGNITPAAKANHDPLGGGALKPTSAEGEPAEQATSAEEELARQEQDEVDSLVFFNPLHQQDDTSEDYDFLQTPTSIHGSATPPTPVSRGERWRRHLAWRKQEEQDRTFGSAADTAAAAAVVSSPRGTDGCLNPFLEERMGV